MAFDFAPVCYVIFHFQNVLFIAGWFLRDQQLAFFQFRSVFENIAALNFEIAFQTIFQIFYDRKNFRVDINSLSSGTAQFCKSQRRDRQAAADLNKSIQRQFRKSLPESYPNFKQSNQKFFGSILGFRGTYKNLINAQDILPILRKYCF